jgi:hypothetical protein
VPAALWATGILGIREFYSYIAKEAKFGSHTFLLALNALLELAVPIIALNVPKSQ